MFLASTGCRAGEATSIRLRDLTSIENHPEFSLEENIQKLERIEQFS